jgi:hypothetical protein
LVRLRERAGVAEYAADVRRDLGGGVTYRGNLGQLQTPKSAGETKEDLRETFRKWDVSRDHFEIFPPEGKSRWDPQVATVVYWKNGAKQTLSCDRFDEYRVNLRAVYLALESLRLADQRGILPELAAAAAGLLGPGAPKGRPAHEVLGIYPDATIEEAEAMFKVKARLAHPDKGGSEAAMKELNNALEEFKRERGG